MKEVETEQIAPSTSSANDKRTRRPYTSPRITVFGDVEELTNAAGNLGSDGVFTSRTAA